MGGPVWTWHASWAGQHADQTPSCQTIFAAGTPWRKGRQAFPCLWGLSCACTCARASPCISPPTALWQWAGGAQYPRRRDRRRLSLCTTLSSWAEQAGAGRNAGVREPLRCLNYRAAVWAFPDAGASRSQAACSLRCCQNTTTSCWVRRRTRCRAASTNTCLSGPATPTHRHSRAGLALAMGIQLATNHSVGNKHRLTTLWRHLGLCNDYAPWAAHLFLPASFAMACSVGSSVPQAWGGANLNILGAL